MTHLIYTQIYVELISIRATNLSKSVRSRVMASTAVPNTFVDTTIVTMHPTSVTPADVVVVASLLSPCGPAWNG